jgi:hypothetical protein
MPTDRAAADRAAGPAAPSFSKTKTDRADLLTNIPVSASNFAGTLSVTHLDYDEATGQLLFSGTLTRADGATDTFSRVPGILDRARSISASRRAAAGYTIIAAGYSNSSANNGQPLFATAAQGTCSILFLNIQPIHLDLLGLVVNLDVVTLDVHGETGPGNLLGNLLCALTGLLDNVGGGATTAIQQKVAQVNSTLAGA